MEIFESRPQRFHLLENGLQQCGWNQQERLELLEVGCGQGDAANWIAKTYHHNVLALDISREWIWKAERMHSEEIKKQNLSFLCEDILDLKTTKEQFDGIYCEASLSSIVKIKETIKKMWDLLKPGGTLLVTDYLARSSHRILEKGQNDILCFQNIKTREEWEQLFEEQGFLLVYYKEFYGELLQLGRWICKNYKISPSQLYKKLGKQGKFPGSKNITYGQMIFKK